MYSTPVSENCDSQWSPVIGFARFARYIPCASCSDAIDLTDAVLAMAAMAAMAASLTPLPDKPRCILGTGLTGHSNLVRYHPQFDTAMQLVNSFQLVILNCRRYHHFEESKRSTSFD